MEYHSDAKRGSWGRPRPGEKSCRLRGYEMSWWGVIPNHSYFWDTGYHHHQMRGTFGKSIFVFATLSAGYKYSFEDILKLLGIERG